MLVFFGNSSMERTLRLLTLDFSSCICFVLSWIVREWWRRRLLLSRWDCLVPYEISIVVVCSFEGVSSSKMLEFAINFCRVAVFLGISLGSMSLCVLGIVSLKYCYLAFRFSLHSVNVITNASSLWFRFVRAKLWYCHGEMASVAMACLNAFCHQIG